MNNDIVSNLYNKYDLNNNDEEYLNSIMLPIISNPFFKRRMTNEFLHHGNITLGEHIIEDTILTYLLSKKRINKKKYDNFRMDLAIKISMLHDLYTVPWQNNIAAKVKHFFNKHGFRHPIEAVINGITWYPELFQNNSDSVIIIDGILHHMFPLPVRYLNNDVELKNKKLFDNLDNKFKEMINNSLQRKKLGPLSFSKSKYLEGRIMAKADRIVSRKQIQDFSSLKALITGNNKKI